MKPRVFLLAAFAVSGLCGFARADDPATSDRGTRSDQLIDDLLKRLPKLIDKQVAVRDGTQELSKVIQDRKPRSDEPAALKLAASQKEILDEVARVFDALKKEKDDLAGVVLEFFGKLPQELKDIEGRLKGGDVGQETQASEEAIIKTFEVMSKVLRNL